MDGLTNIIAKIDEQNTAECKAIIDSAESKAKEIIENAKITAKSVSDKILADASKKASVIDSKAVSSSELEYKRVLLAKKAEIIESSLALALEAIADCGDEEYFGYIEKLILNGAVEGEGVVYFNSKDISRLPEGFIRNMNEKLGDGKSIKLSDKAVSCIGGCVIEYPEMRIDCSFESLVADKKDDIRDEINRALFA